MRRRDLALAAGLALLFTAVGHAWLGPIGLNLGDDGFLVHGVQRTVAGDVPLLDFQSYEPGRYYWCAALARIWGDDFLGVRHSIALFQGIGLFAGLVVARRALGSPWLLPLAALVLWAWMFPRRKVFEPSLAMLTVCAGMALLERPNLRRHFLCGAWVGLVLFFGRNHALYGALGTLGLLLLAHWKRGQAGPALWAKGFSWAAGGLVGALPLWLLMLLEPGFAGAFFDSVRFFAERGSNLPKPYHWPWDMRELNLTGFAVTAAYLLPVVIYPLGWILALRTRPGQLCARAPFLAAAFVGTFYAHHASVRSDASHLAESLAPALLACLALPSALGWPQRRVASLSTWALLLFLSVPAVLRLHPELSLFAPGSRKLRLVDYSPYSGAGTLRVVAPYARYLKSLEKALETHVPEGAPFLVAPRFPGIYCLREGSSAPLWELFMAWKEDESGQRDFLERFERAGVDHVLVIEMPLDNDDSYLFQNTHPLVWLYLQQSFDRIPTPELGSNHVLLRRSP